jgi:hypothetical protein
VHSCRRAPSLAHPPAAREHACLLATHPLLHLLLAACANILEGSKLDSFVSNINFVTHFMSNSGVIV